MSELDDIKQALTDLGDTAYKVGLKLIALNCMGYRKAGAACPVFHYLTLVKGIERIERVVVDEVWIGDEPYDTVPEPAGRIPLPEPVGRFVAEFDDGAWPQLELTS